MKKKPLILLVSGGTGGHSFPALAVEQALISLGANTGIITDNRGLPYFKKSVGKVYSIAIPQLTGQLWQKPYRLLLFLKAILTASKLLQQLRPDALIGFGSYTMLPSFIAARNLKIPHVFLEQNALLGRANRLFLSSANAIAIGFPKVKAISDKHHHKIHWLGNPIRTEFFTVRKKPLNRKRHYHLVITGGSQAAEIFADIVPQAIKQLPKNIQTQLRISQQCKAQQIPNLIKYYQTANIKAEVSDFFDTMPKLLTQADLVIMRAGASSIAEVCAIGKPVIFIPFPYASDNHQFFNANALVNVGAGKLLIEPKKISPIEKTILAKKLSVLIRDLLQDTTARSNLAKNAKQWQKPHAASDLAKLTLSILAKSK